MWDFQLIFFYINKSYLGRWREDWRFFFSKTTADIRHFVFFARAECVQKNCLCILSMREKIAYAGWACAKKLPTQADCALKKTVKTGNKFTHTEPALTICLRMLSLRKKLPMQAGPALKKLPTQAECALKKCLHAEHALTFFSASSACFKGGQVWKFSSHGFFYFYTIEPLWVGNFRAKIKNSKF